MKLFVSHLKNRFDSLPKFTIICKVSKVKVPIVIRFRPAQELHLMYPFINTP